MPMPKDRLVYSTDAARDRPRADRSAHKPSDPGRPPGEHGIHVERQRKGRRGKTVTVITGLPGDEAQLRTMLKRFKDLCGAGGTLKDGHLEVQGDHRDRLVELLREMGYQAKPK